MFETASFDAERRQVHGSLAAQGSSSTGSRVFAFIHIEKAAGLTINWIMRRRFGARHCYVEPWTTRDTCFSAADFRKLSRWHPALESIAGHPIKPWSDLADAVQVRYYTFLREPLSRCAAHYQYQIDSIGRRISFDDWINTQVFRNFQVKKLAGSADLERAIEALERKVCFTGLVERFDESLVMLKRCLGDPALDVSYERRNTASRNAIKKQLLSDPSSRQKLEAANALDLQLYDYVVDRLYPAQQERLGPVEPQQLEGLSHPPARRPTAKMLAYTLHRNLVYKPVLYTHRWITRHG
jgi:hypothetical protein